jgi:type IV pilus assembly protein PilC
MPIFHYVAILPDKKKTKGIVESANISAAKLKLAQSGFEIVSIHAESIFAKEIGASGVGTMDLAVFSHQFSVLIASGIPLLKALSALAEEASNQRFRLILQQVRSDIENGSSLSVALMKHSNVFSPFFVNLIKSGEAGGILPMVLNRLAKHLEKEEDLRRKVVSSFAYPIVVSVVAVGVVTFLLIFIVPVFRSVYKTMKLKLPGPTVALLAASNILLHYWWLLLMIAGGLVFFIQYTKKNEKLGLAIDRFKLHMPYFGLLFRKVAISRFVRTLATMIGSGLNLSSSLNIAKDVTGNHVVANAIEKVRQNVIQGKDFSLSLREVEFFPPMVVQMISAGEESGHLNEMLDKCADFLDDAIDIMIKGLLVKLEPILTMFLAVLIGFIALAVYLPMFDLIRQISH